jgi:hypothetical protein
VRVPEHDRHVVLVVGQAQRPFPRVVDQVEPVQAAIDVLGLHVVGVVVVPERGAALAVRVAVDAGVAGIDQVGRMAVAAGRHVRAVDVHRGAHAELVVLGDDHLAAGPGPDRRPDEPAVVAQDLGLEAGEDPGPARPHRHAVEVGVAGGAHRPKHGRHRHPNGERGAGRGGAHGSGIGGDAVPGVRSGGRRLRLVAGASGEGHHRRGTGGHAQR